MKGYRVALVVLTVVVLATPAVANESQWQVIRRFLQTDTSEPNQQFEAYLGSLSADELLAAARECAGEIEAAVKPADWDAASMNLGFLHEYYPQKTDGLTHIAPLLKDLQDNSQGVCWRHCLMQLLGTEWTSRIGIQQSLNAGNAMAAISCDPCEPVILRSKAVRQSAGPLVSAYHRNLCNDPRVKELIGIGKRKKREEVLDQAISGKLQLQQETLKRSKTITEAIHRAVDGQVQLFSDPNMPTGLRSGIIAAWVTFNRCKVRDSERIKQVLDRAVQNYKRYDEKLWHQLVRTDIVYFKNEKAKPIVQQMIDEIKDKRQKKALVRLKKQIQKGKYSPRQKPPEGRRAGGRQAGQRD